MKCPECGAEMKPLAFSMYCPNDCDRAVEEEIDPEKTPKLIEWKREYLGSAVGSGTNDDDDFWPSFDNLFDDMGGTD